MSTALTILCNATAGLQTGGLAFEVVLAGADNAPPEWIQLTPRGAVTARDGRKFTFDPEALAATFAGEGLKLPIDFNHESEHVETVGSKPARAWIIDLQPRPAGLFGRVEWLTDAVAALAAKHYRYTSPTFWSDKSGAAIRMKGAALVASPALGMPAIASAHQHHEDAMDKTLAAALGLSETATVAEAVAAAAALKAVADPAKFVAKDTHEATLAALNEANARIKTIDDEAFTAKCNALIDDGAKAGKIAPATKAHYLAHAKANYDGCKALIEALPKIVIAGASDAGPGKTSGDAADAVTLGAKARAYMDEQLAKGITVSAADAVAHIQGASA